MNTCILKLLFYGLTQRIIRYCLCNMYQIAKWCVAMVTWLMPSAKKNINAKKYICHLTIISLSKFLSQQQIDIQK